MDEILAKRYADAFMQYTKDGAGLEKSIDDCKNIKKILSQSPELLELLKTPGLAYIEKTGLIDRLLGNYFSEDFIIFIKFLLKKGRIDKLLDIVEYIRVNYSYGNKVQVLLKTSYVIELNLLSEIAQKLEKRLEREIKLYITLDGSLLGGIKAIVGNTIIDSSVRRRLDDLRESLEGVKVA